MWLKVFSAGLVFLATPALAQDQTPDRERLGPALGAVLQADGPTAREQLEALASAGLSGGTEQTRLCTLERLTPEAPLSPPSADAPFSDQALHIFRLYWREAAAAPEARGEALGRLAGRMAELLRDPDMEPSAIEPAMLERIRAEGRYALGGRTGLLQDLMVWSSQEERDVEVALPEGEHTTRLFLLDDFQSRGWSSWLSCGSTGTGGWAKPEGLYAIAPSWDLDAEEFTASFLGHEAQHSADYISWPDLPGRELEYRAKLTELSLADETLDSRLGSFERNQSDNESDPHSHANKRVLAALRARLGLAQDADLTAVPNADICEAARQELFADSARRRTASSPDTGE